MFVGKCVYFVVYAKPTLLQYASEAVMGSHVDCKDIEPLIIGEIVIKAKKR